MRRQVIVDGALQLGEEFRFASLQKRDRFGEAALEPPFRPNLLGDIGVGLEVVGASAIEKKKKKPSFWSN
ncbi:MAG: hypothetical protein KC931_19430, partial [Candidatus Omnitrophica bacterium]|nr:hypothetical protein [Candidatus Omnitrophota bacterium]